jgi:hypothetical protein
LKILATIFYPRSVPSTFAHRQQHSAAQQRDFERGKIAMVLDQMDEFGDAAAESDYRDLRLRLALQRALSDLSETGSADSSEIARKITVAMLTAFWV